MMAKKNGLDKRISLAISAKTDLDIKAAAKRASRTPSSWARFVIEEALTKSSRRKARV